MPKPVFYIRSIPSLEFCAVEPFEPTKNDQTCRLCKAHSKAAPSPGADGCAKRRMDRSISTKGGLRTFAAPFMNGSSAQTIASKITE